MSRCSTVIAVLTIVRHKEYFSEYFGCHISPIKRSWDIVVRVDRDFCVSSVSLGLILQI